MSTSRTRVHKALRSAARSVLSRIATALPVNSVLESASDDRPLRRVLVVTGPHRSGTTIMGRLLAHAPRAFVLHEPFNLDWGLSGVPCRYPYLKAGQTPNASGEALRRFLVTGAGQWLGHGRPLPPNHRRVRANRRNVRGLRPLGYATVVKDPFLLLALGWVNSSLSPYPPIVTLRHPCAWVSSLQRRSMHPRAALESFRAQDGFGDPVVTEILAQRDWEHADLVSAGAATWACLVRMLDVQLDDGARAKVVRMEDFAADPHAVVRELYAVCGLTLPHDFDQLVSHYTGDENIVTPDEPVLHVLRRNSAALAEAWRTRMSESDQKTIRQITEPVAGRWYDSW